MPQLRWLDQRTEIAKAVQPCPDVRAQPDFSHTGWSLIADDAERKSREIPELSADPARFFRQLVGVALTGDAEIVAAWVSQITKTRPPANTDLTGGCATGRLAHSQGHIHIGATLHPSAVLTA